MCVHIGMNSVIGARTARPSSGALNFSWLALGLLVLRARSARWSPATAIEGFGHAGAFLLLAFFPLLALGLLLPRKASAAAARALGGKPPPARSVPRARAAGARFIVSGMLAMGWDLYSFLMPLYGARLGLAATTIGGVMASFAPGDFRGAAGDAGC